MLADRDLAVASQADSRCRVAERVPAHNDAQVAAFATCATVSQLRKVLCKEMFSFPEDADPDGDAAGGALDDAAAAGLPPAPIVDPAAEAPRLTAAEAAASLVMGDDGSRFFLHVEASVETGALVRQALSEARDRLFDASHAKATWADALVDVCGRSLGAAPKPRQSHYRVLVHLDTAGGWVNAGSAVPPSLLRKVTCDGRVAPLWETSGRPVNVGRSMRIVPEHTRRLVEDRDRECLFPGCHVDRFLEVHHLVHWADGGPTDTANLGCLCPFHHDAHHRGEFDISGNADEPETVRIAGRDGSMIDPVGRPAPPGGSLPQPPQGHSYQHPAGEAIQTRWLYFPPPPTQPNRRRLHLRSGASTTATHMGAKHRDLSVA
ncbi:MAG: HNH endonuclease signature motif containing protein [Nocardioidaceae bacterium]